MCLVNPFNTKCGMRQSIGVHTTLLRDTAQYYKKIPVYEQLTIFHNWNPLVNFTDKQMEFWRFSQLGTFIVLTERSNNAMLPHINSLIHISGEAYNQTKI